MSLEYSKSWDLGHRFSINDNTLSENYLNMVFSQDFPKNIPQGDRVIVAAIGTKVTCAAFKEWRKFFDPIPSNQAIKALIIGVPNHL